MLTLVLLSPLLSQDPAPLTQTYPFEDAETPPFAARADGEGAERKGTGPKLQDGELVVLEPWWRFETSAAFPAPGELPARVLECSWTQALSLGSEGIAFAWLDVATHGAEGQGPRPEQWEVPNLPGTFAIGFDASDPVSYEPFRGSGNIHNRPQHEVSLHWNGAERIKKLTQLDFRDEEPHRVHLRVEWQPGGALIDLRLDEETLFDRWLLTGMTPYAGRAAFGGRNGETAGWATVDDLELTCAGPFLRFAEPLAVVALERVLNDSAHVRNEAQVTFPEDNTPYSRILCTLRLDKPETRFDPWDRLAHLYLLDDAGDEVELLRYITPYHKGGEWIVDVTDWRPYLAGERTLVQACGTQGEGWLVSVTFHFYPGESEELAYRVVPLWQGKCVLGDPERPTADFFEPHTVTLDQHTTRLEVRSVVTGHGMSPNSDNAAEFMPLGRTLTIGDQSWSNLLWKTDNYLNPCRPQGGTWKYDRAGWAPGDVVQPWRASLSTRDLAAREVPITYTTDPYENHNRGQTWDPFHQVAAYAVLYREVPGDREPR